MNSLLRLLLVLSLGILATGCSSSARIGTKHHHVGVAGSIR